jgi:hypothetical protein
VGTLLFRRHLLLLFVLVLFFVFLFFLLILFLLGFFTPFLLSLELLLFKPLFFDIGLFLLLTVLAGKFKEAIHPGRILPVLVLCKQDVLKLQALPVDPRVGIVELDHVQSLLGRHEGRSQLVRHFLLGQQQFLHLDLALELPQVE